MAAFGDGRSQGTISLTGGPTLTLGTFSKPFLDYTQLSVSGVAPSSRVKALQIRSTGGSRHPRHRHHTTNRRSIAAQCRRGGQHRPRLGVLRQRDQLQHRTALATAQHDLGFYFNPYEGIGGFRFRLNDFNFTGTGRPFIPTHREICPTNWKSDRSDAQGLNPCHLHRSNDCR